MQSESSKFASLLFDQGFQIVLKSRIVANVPEPIRTPSDVILHGSDCCLFSQFSEVFLYGDYQVSSQMCKFSSLSHSKIEHTDYLGLLVEQLK